MKINNIFYMYISKFKKQPCPFCGKNAISFLSKGHFLYFWKEIKCPNCKSELQLNQTANIIRAILLVLTLAFLVVAWINIRSDLIIRLFWIWFVSVILASEFIILPLAKIEKRLK